MQASTHETLIRFDDIAVRSGIEFIPTNGREAGRFTILESLGTGVAIVDLDGDLQLDIVAPGGGRFDQSGDPIGTASGIFRQRTLLQFQNTAAVSGINTDDFYSHGVVAGDWNNDGFEDLVITGYQTLRWYQNAGDGTFLDVTQECGGGGDAWATSAAFLDADSDGNLELYVVNYVDWAPDDDRKCLVGGHRDICPPGEFEAAADSLYHNHGDGTFHECSFDRGLTEVGKGLAVISSDLDLDGDTDIYVANDTTANLLYLNNGRGLFTEQALVSGCALGATAEAEGSMGVDVADFNADGLPDIWVSNYENQSFAMYQSRGPGIFQHVSNVTGISAVGQLYVGFGTVAFDAELDGDFDIFAANGHVMYATGRAPVRQRPLVYENLGKNRFRNIAEQIGEYGRSEHMGRGVAAGDLDQDGLIDLVVAHTNEPMSVLRNSSRKSGHSFSVRLIGRASNRSAIGAQITVNGPQNVLTSTSGGSYLSDSSRYLHRGFGPNTSQLGLRIVWPSGQSQSTRLKNSAESSILEPPAREGD